MVGVGVGMDGVSCEQDQLSEGTGTGTTMIGLPRSIASRPSLSLNTSGVGAGAGVALPKRKSNMWPRVDSSEMYDGSETGIRKGGKQVVREGEGAENIEMKPLPTSGQKITAKTKDSKADVEKEAEGESAGGIGFWGWGWIWIRTGLRDFFHYSRTWVMFHFFLSCIFPLMFLFFFANFFNERSTSTYIYISSRIASFSA